MNQESQQIVGGGTWGKSPPEAPSISAFEWASGACIFTYFCIHFYMHNSIIMCQRDNHPDSTKNYKKNQVQYRKRLTMTDHRESGTHSNISDPTTIVKVYSVFCIFS